MQRPIRKRRKKMKNKKLSGMLLVLVLAFMLVPGVSARPTYDAACQNCHSTGGTLSITNIAIASTTVKWPSVVVNNNAPIGASLTWASSDTANGTINSTTGLFTAVRQGTTTITATNGTISGSASVTVKASRHTTEDDEHEEDHHKGQKQGDKHEIEEDEDELEED